MMIVFLILGAIQAILSLLNLLKGGAELSPRAERKFEYLLALCAQMRNEAAKRGINPDGRMEP